MNYFDSFYQLRAVFSSEDSLLYFGNLAMHRQEFVSDAHRLLPGKDQYCCELHGEYFDSAKTFFNSLGEITDQIYVRDIDVAENEKFSYRIFMPVGMKKAEKAVFLFHGFNEKSWDKYLPWAQFLCETLSCAVILFPIAFHMNRTLSGWSDKRKMFLLSEKRKAMFPNVVDSSLTNVAISLRLHTRPQRFIWSGLQTYYDVISFLENCREGKNALIHPQAQFHFVAYSIGCLLAEILKLANYNHYFSESKLCLFCGGAVFNRLSPVSKYILDSEANIALYAYLVEHFEKHMARDLHLKHYIDGPHDEGHVFYSMLDYKVKREYREALFRRVKQDVMAVGLKQDAIIPPYEIVNTLQGAARDIPILVETDDFPFPYNHVTPFPVTEKNKELIDENFKRIFQKIASFIG